MRLTKKNGTFPGLGEAPFDVAAFLTRPLVARLATAGPRVRPVWFLWEDDAFWVLTGPWSRLERRLAENPTFELVVDSCDLDTGTVHQVIARGLGRTTEFDAARGRRKLSRYLGKREKMWDPRFSLGAEGNRWALLEPTTLWAVDMSFRPVHNHETSQE
ncbi:pyridoxamine 5'-phosphate oxidase family protein [Streptomyces sp. NPDC048430]|uniref:pyridoxamine 5'-phosphate oxidase family protein n=1 Tax=Streptomyces sp. NPDC048430 TaxID=3155388 RepID=UPI003418890A